MTDPQARTLKISFEHVSAIAHPEYYRGDQSIVFASQVPDEHWTRTERIGDGIWSQYDGLRRLIAAGELVRDVRLGDLRLVHVQWKDVTPRGEVAP